MIVLNLFYIETIILCITLLVLIAFKLLTNSNHIECYKQYMITLLSSLVLGVLNFIVWFIDKNSFSYSNIINNFINIIIMIVICIIYYNWFLYFENINKSKLINTKIKRLIFKIPLLILIVILCLSYITNWIIYIDDFNFIRLNYYYIFIGITMIYFLITLFLSLIRLNDKNKLINKRKNMTIFFFCLYQILVTIICLLYFGKPHIIIAITLGFVYTYLDFLNQLITVDPLTKLNNKSQLINILTNEIKNSLENNDLYLLMLDMDDFKAINDNYGHVEGDQALITVSNILKQVCYDKNCLVFRYGGDEFNIIVKTSNEEKVKLISRNIIEELDNYNKNSNKKYKLKISIGYFKYNNNIKSVSDFISKADKELYNIKRKKYDIIN